MPAAGGGEGAAGECGVTGTLSVTRLSLIESAAMSSEAFGAAARRQWCVGTHRLSLQIIAAGSQHPLGSSPPKAMHGLSLETGGMLTVPITPGRTSFPLLVKVVAHQWNTQGTVLGIATVDPSSFFACFAADSSRDGADGSSTSPDSLDVSGEGAGASVTSLSDAFGHRRLHLTLPMFPAAGLRPDTVHAVVALELEASLASSGAPSAGLRSLGAPSGLALEYARGPLRISALDLYFPAFATATEGLTVSNVVCAYNSSETHLWVNLQSDSSAYYAVPSGGLVIRPRQRAYFSVTAGAPPPTSPNAVSSTSSAGPAGRNFGDASPVPMRLPPLSAAIELYCVEVDTSLTHPPVAFQLHDNAPREAEELVKPYHLWLNGSCLTNRPLPIDEGAYVRGVLPVFAPPGGFEGSSDPADISASQSVVPVSAGVTPGMPWPSRGDDDAGLGVRDRDSGAVVKAGRTGRLVPSSPTRLIVDVGSRPCRCTIKLGVIAGTAIPAPRVCGPFQPGYRAMITALDPTWSVDIGETPIVLPHPATGDIDFSATPLVVRKAAAAQGHQCLRVTLTEVANAAPSGATAVADRFAPSDSIDEVPIALGTITVWPLDRCAMLRPLAVALLFLDSFSRYDDMAATGVALRKSDITFVPMDAHGSAASPASVTPRR